MTYQNKRDSTLHPEDYNMFGYALMMTTEEVAAYLGLSVDDTIGVLIVHRVHAERYVGTTLGNYDRPTVRQLREVLRMTGKLPEVMP